MTIITDKYPKYDLNETMLSVNFGKRATLDSNWNTQLVITDEEEKERIVMMLNKHSDTMWNLDFA